MRCPSKTEDEAGRLEAIADYGLHLERATNIDPIVRMAASMFDCPVAAVNIIGDTEVFLTASHGIDDYDNARDYSFCAHAILQDEVMVVEDATLDPRFHDNPLVTDGLIRFYAGVPLRTKSGHALGALCVIDAKQHSQFAGADQLRLIELASFVMDKLELRRLQRAAAAEAANAEAASAAASSNAVLGFDECGTITVWNDAASKMFGRTAAESIGRPLDVVVAEDDIATVRDEFARMAEDDTFKGATIEFKGTRASGSRFPASIYWSRWTEGDATRFGAIVHDLGARPADHDVLFRLANYDPLTGLPDRNLLGSRFEVMTTENLHPSLIVTDLNGFTDLNNSLGQAAGDRVLRLLAERLVKSMPDDASVYSIGNAEFATLVGSVDGADKLQAVAKAINSALVQPLSVDGHEVRIAGNSGMALGPEHGHSLEELLGSANLALLHARSIGRGSAFLFAPSLRSEALARRMHEAELYRALERDEFVLFYQPQINLADDTLMGAEALIRWRHPVRGLLAPAAFLSDLENSPLAEDVGKWIVKTACEQALDWRKVHPDFRMSVNLFAVQFRIGDLPRIVADKLRMLGLPPDALLLEITENIVLNQKKSVLAQVEELNRFGVKLSFDDFGTGHASLNLLRDYPVADIKIDKSFTQLVQTSPKDRAIVAAMIGLAHSIGIGVVAEGIESAGDRDYLRGLGCEKGQGYFFGKPVPPELFFEQFLFDAERADDRRDLIDRPSIRPAAMIASEERRNEA